MNFEYYENSLYDEEKIFTCQKDQEPQKTKTIKKKFPILFTTQDQTKFYFLESTPMREQYLRIKADHLNKIVLFQRGSFYQAYFDDAKFIKEKLNYNWKEKDILVGIPEQNLESDILKLVQIQQELVLCQQKQDSVTCDELIIPRYINGIYTQGVIGLGVLNVKDLELEYNYLYSIQTDFKIMGIVILDTINKIGQYHPFDNDIFTNLKVLIQQYSPAQCIITDYRLVKYLKGHYVTLKYYPSQSCNPLENAEKMIKTYLKEQHLDQFWDQFIFVETKINSIHLPSFTTEQLNLEHLFKILNNCASKDGERVLRQWLHKPLIDVNEIRQRQQAILDLSRLKVVQQIFHRELRLMKDIKRQISQLYGYANTYHKALSEVSYKPFLVLKTFLNDIKSLLITVKFKICSNSFKSALLGEMLDQEIIMGQIKTIEDFQNQIIWEGHQSDIPCPKDPQLKHSQDLLHEEFDNLRIEAELEVKRLNELVQEGILVNNKNKFEIQLPFNFKVDKEFQLSSKSKGFNKYQTQKLIDLTDQQYITSYKLKNFLLTFQKQLFEDFISQKAFWNNLADQLGQLDALFSLSMYSTNYNMPEFTHEFCLKCYDFNHPFIKNGTQNTIEIQFDQINCAVITGCNGSGKSTLLRSLGCLVILAQIGCAVPCKKMILKPFKSIYTRMGAQDSLDKSTFQIEMEQCQKMLNEKESLLLIDELGRGTSTYDGIALAYAILRQLIRQESIIVFSTHFYKYLENLDVEFYKFVDGYYLMQGTNKQSISNKVLEQCMVEKQVVIRAKQVTNIVEQFQQIIQQLQ